MRQICIITYFIFLFSVSYAQDNSTEKKLDYNSKNKPLKEIIAELSDLYSVRFFYSSSRININGTVNVKSDSATIDDILNEICSKSKITYRINKNNIVLFPSEKIAVSEINSVSGYVYDSLSGERLIGANVIFTEIMKGTMSNNYGYYIYYIPKGLYKVTCSYMGYIPETFNIDISGDTVFHFALKQEVMEIKEIVLKGGKQDKKNSMLPGTDELPMNITRNQPSLLGENDIIQGLKMLPGIQSNTDGFNGLFIRGGTPQQTSFIVDDAPLFNMYHMSGWFSSVNPDAIKDVTVFKSNLPSKTGGSIASIVDLKLRDGNNRDFILTGGIGTLTSRITLEGPIVKEKASFIISGRRSYFDQIINLFKEQEEEIGNFYFYDLSSKINYTVDKKNRLYLSAYLSNDQLVDSGGISWGNKLYSLRWNHLYSENIFSNLTLSGSYIRHKFYEYSEDRNLFSLNTGINYYSLKYDFTYFSKNNQKINFGINSYYQELLPLQNMGTDKETTSVLANNITYKRAIYNLYAESEIALGQKFSSLIGMRVSAAQNFSINESFEIHPEPLISFNYKIKDHPSAKICWSRNYQYNHGASIFELLIPFDRIVFSDSILKAQYVDHISAGYFYRFKKLAVDFSFEPFVSLMQNQYRFYTQNQVLIGKNYYNAVVNGENKVYGIELSLRKTSGKFSGMINYTWSKINRKEFGNETLKFNPFFDRRNDLTLTGSIDLSKKITISASWVYMSGNPYNQAYSKYEIRGIEIPKYSDMLYNSRMPSYHRSDLCFRYRFGKNERMKHNITLSVYNVYSRTNSLFYYYYSDDEKQFNMYQFYTFKFFPSFSYEFSFK